MQAPSPSDKAEVRLSTPVTLHNETGESVELTSGSTLFRVQPPRVFLRQGRWSITPGFIEIGAAPGQLVRFEVPSIYWNSNRDIDRPQFHPNIEIFKLGNYFVQGTQTRLESPLEGEEYAELALCHLRSSECEDALVAEMKQNLGNPDRANIAAIELSPLCQGIRGTRNRYMRPIYRFQYTLRILDEDGVELGTVQKLEGTPRVLSQSLCIANPQ